jgi:hypothetical protein
MNAVLEVKTIIQTFSTYLAAIVSLLPRVLSHGRTTGISYSPFFFNDESVIS